MEAELKSKEPMEMGDNASALEDKGDRDATMTLVEHREPVAALVGGWRGMDTHGDVTESRKRAMSEDAALE